VLKEGSAEDLQSIKDGQASVKKVYTKIADAAPVSSEKKQKTIIKSPEAFKFLKSALSMFAEKNREEEAAMLAEHFAEFYQVALSAEQSQLEASTNVSTEVVNR
jgi:hypothetical protein